MKCFPLHRVTDPPAVTPLKLGHTFRIDFGHHIVARCAARIGTGGLGRGPVRGRRDPESLSAQCQELLPHLVLEQVIAAAAISPYLQIRCTNRLSEFLPRQIPTTLSSLSSIAPTADNHAGFFNISVAPGKCNCAAGTRENKQAGETKQRHSSDLLVRSPSLPAAQAKQHSLRRM